MAADTKTVADAFPKAQVIVALSEWWANEKLETDALAALASEPKAKVSVLTPIIEIDSHRVLRALLEIERVIGRDVPEKLIRSGGYESFEELVTDIIPKVEKLVVKGDVDD